MCSSLLYGGVTGRRSGSFVRSASVMHDAVSFTVAMPGVSVGLDIAYERSSVLESHRNDSGTYRIFDHQDITAFIRIHTYHNCGFFTKETERLLIQIL